MAETPHWQGFQLGRVWSPGRSGPGVPPPSRVDLCPVEWGGDGVMLMRDARCVPPRATLADLELGSGPGVPLAAVASFSASADSGLGGGALEGASFLSSGRASDTGGDMWAVNPAWARVAGTVECGCSGAPSASGGAPGASGDTLAHRLSAMPPVPAWLVWLLVGAGVVGLLGGGRR